MLTKTESSGLRAILNDIEDEDLFCLFGTVTRRLCEAHSRPDAIETILSCIKKPSDLLKRQKVTKKILFNYLLKVKGSVSPECGKAACVKMCLEEWNSIEVCKESDYFDESNVSENTEKNNNINVMNKMGVEFSKWFFSIYNQLTEFGPEHFWPDCVLKADLKSSCDVKEVTIVGANDAVVFLANLILVDKFYFHANDATFDSVTCEQEPHGLVKIIISGVLHRFSNCIGLFDSMFGLVQNPTCDYNWKIKTMYIKIHISGSTKADHNALTQYPSICQTT